MVPVLVGGLFSDGTERGFGLRRFGAEDGLGRGERFAEGWRRHLGAARPDISGGCHGGAFVCGGRRWRKVAVQSAQHFVLLSKASLILRINWGRNRKSWFVYM